MNTDLKKRLEIPYKKDHDNFEAQLEERLGLNLESLHKLHNLIFHDLDEINHGVSWWSNYQIEEKKRILISDHLLQSCPAIRENLLEARLHLEELFENWKVEEEGLSRAVSVVNGEARVGFNRTSPYNDLPGAWSALHMKGFVSSLCSALDCSSAILCGTFGLPLDIFKVGFGELRNKLIELKDSLVSHQLTLSEQLDDLEGSSRPSGWIKYLFDYRNMLLHKGRRTQFIELMPAESGVLDHKGRSFIRTSLLRRLPKNPAVSDIESLKEKEFEILEEKAEVTVNALFEAVKCFVVGVGTLAIQVWTSRKSEPNLIIQPEAQWPRIRAASYRAFSGFGPRTPLSKYQQIRVVPSAIKRMRAASLDGENIELWKNSDT